VKIQITQRCSRIIRGQTCFTGEFIQGYVVALNSTAGMPKDWKAGYNYGTNDWNHNAYDKNGAWVGHSFGCPLSKPYWRSNFCLGYDAALAYQNSDY